MSAVNEAYAQRRAMEEMAVRLAGDEQQVRMAMASAAAAVDTIRTIKEGKAARAFLPIGYGVMVKASVSAGDRIPVEVGAGVVVEKSADSAVLFLESRMKELSVSLNDIVAGRRQVAAGLAESAKRMEQLQRESKSTN